MLSYRLTLTYYKGTASLSEDTLALTHYSVSAKNNAIMTVHP